VVGDPRFSGSPVDRQGLVVLIVRRPGSGSGDRTPPRVA